MIEVAVSAPLDRENRHSEWRQRLVRMGSVALTLLIAVAWLVFLRPGFLGGPATYVIVSGTSMLPTLGSGDLVLALEQDSYSVGDVIVYRVPSEAPAGGTKIVHRVVGLLRGDGYVVQGDSRERPDYWRPSNGEVVGKMRLNVPHIGSGLVFLRTPPGVALIAALTTFLVALGAISESSGAAERGTTTHRLRPARRRRAPTRAGPRTYDAFGPSSSVWTRGLIDRTRPARSAPRGSRPRDDNRS